MVCAAGLTIRLGPFEGVSVAETVAAVDPVPLAVNVVVPVPVAFAVTVTVCGVA
jgi:hypothetical protein